jgi:hypothetical protein
MTSWYDLVSSIAQSLFGLTPRINNHMQSGAHASSVYQMESKYLAKFHTAQQTTTQGIAQVAVGIAGDNYFM